ncbi:EAL domain-containing protein [Aliamphritea spongicola]|nr:EAL domain-containing protein [Aliamphritea spongicola]
MYKAKNSGRNTFQYYSADMHLEAQQRIELENALRKAVVRKEFVLHYQPVIDARTNRIVGAEALIRWQRPDVGLVYPNDFIGLAEECGLITAMGSGCYRKPARRSLRYWINVRMISLSRLMFHVISLSMPTCRSWWPKLCRQWTGAASAGSGNHREHHAQR